jgi:hypothetical protein
MRHHYPYLTYSSNTKHLADKCMAVRFGLYMWSSERHAQMRPSGEKMESEYELMWR